MRLVGYLDGSTRNMKGIADFLRLNRDRVITVAVRDEGVTPLTIEPGSNGSGMELTRRLVESHHGKSVDLVVQPVVR